MNFCLMAYGQTSSGKTYSLFGEENHLQGVIPRFLVDMFKKLNEFKLCEESSFNLNYSFFEIYKEKILDGLDDFEGKGLNLRENKKEGIYVENLKVKQSDKLEEIMEDLKEANERRKVNETYMNGRSSRSHFVITFDLEINYLIDCGDDIDKNKSSFLETDKSNKNTYQVTKKSKIIFIDLAGSEKQTFNKSDVLEEGCHINKSLSILNHVIVNLSKTKGQDFVHYRDSKLTHFLKDILKNSSHFGILGTILPQHQFLTESLNTLNFVSLAKTVKTNPKINFETKSNSMVMQAQLKALVLKIEKLEAEKNGLFSKDDLKDKIDTLMMKMEEVKKAKTKKKTIENRFIKQLDEFINYGESFDPEKGDIEKFKEKLNDFIFAVNEKLVKKDKRSNTEYSSFLNKLTDILNKMEKQTSLLNKKQKDEVEKLFIKRKFSHNINSIKSPRKNKELKKSAISHRTNSNKEKKRKETQTLENEFRKTNKSFSKKLSKSIKENRPTYKKDNEIKKLMYNSKFSSDLRSNFEKNMFGSTAMCHSYVWSSNMDESMVNYKKMLVSPLTYYFNNKTKNGKIFKKISKQGEDLSVIQERALLQRQREELEEMRRELDNRKAILDSKDNTILIQKEKEIDSLKNEIKRLNYKHSLSLKSTREDIEEAKKPGEQKLKQADRRVSNLERQLRNRNKDYLFALKELEKVKTGQEQEKRLSFSSITS